MSQAVIILQARMASTRLPGKVLAPIGARTLLGHCLARLRAGSAAPVMLAITTNPEDDCLVEAAGAYCVPVFRGPDEDVLQRYVLAARSVGARFVVRATADNPVVDIDGPERLLRLLRSTGADYVIEEGLPCGAAVEAVTVEALNRAAAGATTPFDREHVTPLIRRDVARFSPLVVKAPAHLRRPEVRVTVDTDQDLESMRQLASRMGNWSNVPELAQVLRVIDASSLEIRYA